MADIPDDPDRPCSYCGNTSWQKYEEQPPTTHPEGSDVLKHYYYCEECQADGFIYEEGGHIRYTGALR